MRYLRAFLRARQAAAVCAFWASPLLAQTPGIIVEGLPAEPLIGEPFCFEAGFENTGGDEGFGPYVLSVAAPGIQIQSVNFVDVAPDRMIIGTFDASGELTDPVSGTTLTGQEGGQAALARYPVGSVETAKPALPLEVCGVLEPGVTPGVPLELVLIPGFEFGDTSTGNNGAILGPSLTTTVTPQLARITKENTAPENERPPGPSHRFNYRIALDISEQVTLTAIELSDDLPASVQWTGDPIAITATLGSGCVIAETPNAPPTPGGPVTATCDAATGTAGSEDVTVTIPVYITDVLDETGADSQSIVNTANTRYGFDGDLFSDSDTSTVEALHAALQKTVAGTAAPGNRLTYQLRFQLTDYPDAPADAGASRFVIDDTLPDGLRFDDTLELTVNGTVVPITAVVVANPGTGETALRWDIAAALGNTLPNGSRGTLTYSATVLNTYASGEPVQATDPFRNTASLGYELSAGALDADGSGAAISVVPNLTSKTVVSPDPGSLLSPGDSVVFRLALEIPAGNTSNVALTDFLPQPVFDVADFDADSDFRVLPPFEATVPTITVDTGANAISAIFGDIYAGTPSTLAVELTARVTNEPFADELFLTNLLSWSYDNVNDVTSDSLNAAGITVGAPELRITKGIFSIDNPGASITPAPGNDPTQTLVDGNGFAADAGDLITYILTIENLGSKRAYNVIVDDPAVDGLTCAALEPGSVRNGLGIPQRFSGDLRSGITLTGGIPGFEDEIGAPFGSGTILVTQECRLDTDVIAGTTLTNTAGVTWTSTPDASDRFPRVSDDASVEVAAPTLRKRLVTVTPGYSGGLDSAHIGELLTYRVDITVPEGVSPEVRFEDVVDSGLALVDVLSITASTGLSTSAGSFDAVLASAGFLPEGSGSTAADRRLVFGPGLDDAGFGTVTNENSNNAAAEIISISYRARVLNATLNTAGTTRRNLARWYWTAGAAGEQRVETRAPAVTVVEPALRVATTITPSEGDSLTTPQVSIAISHAPGSSADAFDLALSDLLPEQMQVIGAPDLSACAATPDSVGVTPEGLQDRLQARWTRFTRSDTCTLTVTVAFPDNLSAGSRLDNCAVIDWQSLATGDQPLSQPPNNTLGFERTGNPALPGELNNYIVQDCDQFRVFDVGIEKRVTATSEAHTDNIPGTPQGGVSLTIGEEVTFQLVVTVPETDVDGLTVTDVLPATEALMEVLDVSVTAIGDDLSPAVANPAPNLTDSNGDGLDDTVELDFGAVSHVLDGITDNEDRIRVQVRARVRDLGSNINNNSEDNNAIVRFPSLESSDSFPLELVEPLMVVRKSSTVTEADAGDSVIYRIIVGHRAASRIDAKDVTLSDLLPPELVLTPGSVQASAACNVAPDSGPTESGNGFSLGWETFPVDGRCTITYEAQVSINAVTGDTARNTANLNWTSLAGEGAPDERRYDAFSPWEITISDPGLTKDVTATSIPETPFQSGSPITALTIGEEVTFEIVAQFPDGTSDDVVVLEQLPRGDVALRFVSTRITSVGEDLTLSSGASVGNVAINCVPARDSCGRWLLGDVVNTPDARPLENDPADSVTFEVVAVVEDDPTNSGVLGNGDSNLRNRATLTSSAGILLASAGLELVEPLLTLAKLTESGEQPAPIAAGESHRFTLRIAHRNTSTAAALGIRVEDDLDPNLRWVNDATVVSDCPDLVINSPGELVSGAVTFTLGTLPLETGSCTISYEVSADPLLPVPGTFANTAGLFWESAPGSVESRAGVAQARAELLSFNTATIRKVANRTSEPETDNDVADVLAPDAAIGEVVEFLLVTLIDEGTTSGVEISDTLQADSEGELEFLGAKLVYLGNNISASGSGNAVVSGDTVTIDLGTVTNRADGVVNRDDAIAVQIVARVTDAAVNTAGKSLTNSVVLAFDGGDSVNSSALVDIVEPELFMAKTFTTLEGAVATVEITIGNSGTAPAFDLEVTDNFDEALWVPGSLVPLEVPEGFELIAESSAGVTTVTLQVAGDPSQPGSVIAPTETISARFSLRLQNGGEVGVTRIDNTANATASSLPGVKARERQYSTSASDTLLLPRLALTKVWAGPNTPALPGDTLSYTIALENSGEGPALDVLISDTPDAVGEFQAGSVVSSAGGVINLGNAAEDTSIEVAFPTVEAGDTAQVSYTVRVPLPYPDWTVSAERLTNQAAQSNSSLLPDVSDDPGTAADKDPTVVPIAADPIMRVSKTATTPVTTPSALLAYVITYGNIGNQDTRGVLLTETVPDFTRFVASASTAGWSCPDDSGPGTRCDLAIDTLTTTSATARFAVRVDDTVPGGVNTIVNTVLITDDGRENDSAAPIAPSTDQDTVTTPLGAAPLIEIRKDDGGISVSPGDQYAYGIAFRNAGNQVATGVILTETVPADTRFNAAASAPSVWSCPDGSPAGTVCTLFVGQFPPSLQARSARFGLSVLFPARAGVETLFNTVRIEDDGANTLLPLQDTDEDFTPLIALPDLVIEKNTEANTVDLEDTILYTLDYANAGNQDATGVNITEIIPPGTVFLAEGSDPRWSCADRTPAPRRCTLALGPLDSGAGGTVTFAVEVVAVPPSRNIVNAVFIADDLSNGPDPTPANNRDRQVNAFPSQAIPAMGLTSKAVLVILLMLAGGYFERRMQIRRR